jgi:hypothetical protein
MFDVEASWRPLVLCPLYTLEFIMRVYCTKGTHTHEHGA